MLKTIIKSIIYIAIIAFLIVFTVYLIQDLVFYYVDPNSSTPLIIKVVNWIMSIPILGSLISAFLTTLI